MVAATGAIAKASSNILVGHMNHTLLDSMGKEYGRPKSGNLVWKHFSRVGLFFLLLAIVAAYHFGFATLSRKMEWDFEASKASDKSAALDSVRIQRSVFNVIYIGVKSEAEMKELVDLYHSRVAPPVAQHELSEYLTDETKPFTFKNKWDFKKSILYSITTLLMIGYGSQRPETSSGQLVTVIGLVFGIPLTLIMVSKVGTLILRLQDLVYSYSIGLVVKAVTKKQQTKAPLPFCIGVLVLTLIGGTILVKEGLKFKDPASGYTAAAYFVFVSMSTIGFGDFSIESFYAANGTLVMFMVFLVISLCNFAALLENVKELVRSNALKTPEKVLENLMKKIRGNFPRQHALTHLKEARYTE